MLRIISGLAVQEHALLEDKLCEVHCVDQVPHPRQRLIPVYGRRIPELRPSTRHDEPDGAVDGILRLAQGRLHGQSQ